ncbi:MAG: pyrroline-5-carboxylate reductase [Arenicella sp.]|jgi:pyrroline-5-carboxylate reductase|nr:pyrroline-5-carboxylate reductase [Arenicella sp.]
MNSEIKIGFLGGGNMSSAIIGGLVGETSLGATQFSKKSGVFSPNQIFVHDRNAAKNEALCAAFGITAFASAEQLIEAVDVLIIAVKPQGFKTAVIANLDTISLKKPLIISLAAGVRTKSIQAWVDAPLAIVRAMPNTPALIGEGATGLFATSNTSSVHKELADSIMSTVGLSIWVDSESDIDTVTALSGSGPAYFMLLLESMIAAAIKAGLDEDSAKILAVQTARGSALLVAASDKPLTRLRSDITSPKGTTEQAVNSFASSNLDGIVEQAFEAARLRAIEIADELE